MGKTYKTDFLFPESNFFRGFVSVVDLGGGICCNESETGELADAKALYNDWAMVGQDIKKATEKINEQQAAEETK